MINAHIIRVTDENVGERIDKVICQAINGMCRSAVQKIIEDLKGSIHAESELNIGTKFIIVLPLIKTD